MDDGQHKAHRSLVAKYRDSRVLIVEDEVAWQEILKDLLDGIATQIDVAADDRQAKQLLQSSVSYQLALVDVCLDQPSFDLTCQRFFSFLHSQYPRMPVIAVTGRPLEPEEVWTLHRLGVIDFKVKSRINVPEFQECIRNCMQGHFARFRTFISYRRDDGMDFAALLYKELTGRIGEGNVFMDIFDMKGGRIFTDQIADAIDKCQVLVPIIGEQWSTLLNGSGIPRLRDPKDYVRMEIQSALKLSRRLAPVLIGRAELPKVSVLPRSLASVRKYQVIHFTRLEDVDRVADMIIGGA